MVSANDLQRKNELNTWSDLRCAALVSEIKIPFGLPLTHYAYYAVSNFVKENFSKFKTFVVTLGCRTLQVRAG